MKRGLLENLANNKNGVPVQKYFVPRSPPPAREARALGRKKAKTRVKRVPTRVWWPLFVVVCVCWTLCVVGCWWLFVDAAIHACFSGSALTCRTPPLGIVPARRIRLIRSSERQGREICLAFNPLIPASLGVSPILRGYLPLSQPQAPVRPRARGLRVLLEARLRGRRPGQAFPNQRVPDIGRRPCLLSQETKRSLDGVGKRT